MKRTLVNALAALVIALGTLTFFTPPQPADAAVACCTSGDGKATCCGSSCAADETSCCVGNGCE